MMFPAAESNPVLFPQFDMQRITLEELKHILYHAFRDHLTMKDIENIIINEEESLNENSGNCQTEFEASLFLQARRLAAHTLTKATMGIVTMTPKWAVPISPMFWSSSAACSLHAEKMKDDPVRFGFSSLHWIAWEGLSILRRGWGIST
ncbi:hypothetical protein Q9966_011313 [Columba livia]|nr:hypothetical protein Q9966_011313 [Columba livia]